MLGGLLTQYVDWRWTLTVNVPIAAVAIIGTVMFLHDHSTQGVHARLDVPGALLATGGLLAIVYGLSEAEQNGWGSALVLSMFALGAVLLAAFILVERRTPHALLPLHLLRDRNRVGALLAVGLTQIGMFGVFLFLTYYLQGVQGYSPMKTGFAFLPMVVGMMTGAVGISARLLPRVGPASPHASWPADRRLGARLPHADRRRIVVLAARVPRTHRARPRNGHDLHALHGHRHWRRARHRCRRRVGHA